MKKLAIAGVIGCVAVNVLANTVAETPQFKAVPGAYMMFYDHTPADMPSPDAEPLVSIIDNSSDFSWENMRKNKETSEYSNQPGFRVWSGFIKIPAKDMYSFVLSCRNYGSYQGNRDGSHNNVRVLINGKELLHIYSGERDRVKKNDAKRLLLEGGYYSIQIISKWAIYGVNPFTLKFSPKSNPVKKYDVTPATLFHAE